MVLLTMPWLAWLTSPRIGLACLACTSNNSSNAPRRFGGQAARSAVAAVVAGAGTASKADARRGEPSKPRPGEHADPDNDKLRRTATTYDELRRATSYDELAKSISRDVPEYPDILA